MLLCFAANSCFCYQHAAAWQAAPSCVIPTWLAFVTSMGVATLMLKLPLLGGNAGSLISLFLSNLEMIVLIGSLKSTGCYDRNW